MKIKILFLISIILILSCNKEEETNYFIEIKNSSDYTISIKPYNINYISYYKDSITLNPLERELVEDTRRGLKGTINNNYWFIGDSIKVTYNDTLSIYHGSKAYNVTRSLMNVCSFQYENKSEKKHIANHNYTYTFTNADFDEALTK